MKTITSIPKEEQVENRTYCPNCGRLMDKLYVGALFKGHFCACGKDIRSYPLFEVTDEEEWVLER